ncbi:MAG: formate dehydrogenase accessory sulfurtransferase FdhD [Gemmatimonadetes bacterium]|nr:formate dehydrogenase accessory sulfurtransferase FdhD [Gemmatimonadota bacterium]
MPDPLATTSQARPPAIPAPRRRKGSVTRRGIERVRVKGGLIARSEGRDALATEEPLEIRVARADGTILPTSVTMRTPGADFELAAGFLFAEGVLDDASHVLAIRYCVDGEQRYNRVTVHVAPQAPAPDVSLQRNFYTTSSCGVCGKQSIEAALAVGCAPIASEVSVSAATLLTLPARLRAAQKLFDSTGGLHAAALFDLTGDLLRVREDVGRHNAMDKLVGASLLAGELPVQARLMLVSGRLSFELVQKAARAGVPILAGVSAPSSLAVELADQVGMTLVGFLREGSFNVYAGGERVG